MKHSIYVRYEMPIVFNKNDGEHENLVGETVQQLNESSACAEFEICLFFRGERKIIINLHLSSSMHMHSYFSGIFLDWFSVLRWTNKNNARCIWKMQKQQRSQELYVSRSGEFLVFLYLLSLLPLNSFIHFGTQFLVRTSRRLGCIRCKSLNKHEFNRRKIKTGTKRARANENTNRNRICDDTCRSVRA